MATTNIRRFRQETADSPTDNFAVVVPSDSADLSYTETVGGVSVTRNYITRSLAVKSGAVVVTRPDGTDVTLPDMGAPFIWPIRAARVKATGTTAAAGTIVALY